LSSKRPLRRPRDVLRRQNWLQGWLAEMMKMPKKRKKRKSRRTI
jgi:hypothetical protein